MNIADLSYLDDASAKGLAGSHGMIIDLEADLHEKLTVSRNAMLGDFSLYEELRGLDSILLHSITQSAIDLDVPTVPGCSCSPA